MQLILNKQNIMLAEMKINKNHLFRAHASDKGLRVACKGYKTKLFKFGDIVTFEGGVVVGMVKL